MFEIGNIIFIIEILVGQTILLYACPKRDNYAVRMSVSVACCIALAYFFPMPAEIWHTKFSALYQLLRFFVLLGYTMGATAVCYKIPLRTVLSLCVAGYAIQHIGYQLTMLCSSIPVLKEYNVALFGVVRLFELIVFTMTYTAAWYCLGRTIAKNEYYKNSDIRFDLLAVVIIFICVVLTRVSYILSGFYSLSPRIYAIVCCLLALIIQFNLYRMMSEKYEKEIIRQLWKEERRHYELSKHMIDTINIKCHDLKYKLRAHDDKLSQEERRSLERAVNIYDGMVKTGNEVLDVILAENHLQCQSNDIKFTFMGNGEALSFISDSDMYSLFGNALDNAREAVMGLKGNKRVVNLTITKKGDFINVDLVNYFSGELVFLEDRLVTSKKQEEGYHGFGIKSMQMIAQKYGGDLRISVNGDLFSLGIYLFCGTSTKTN